MGYNEIAKLFRDFERYDRYTRDYGVNDTKAQRFNGYLSKLKGMIEELQPILEYNNIEIADNSNTSINEHEIKALNTATRYYFKMETRTIAAHA